MHNACNPDLAHRTIHHTTPAPGPHQSTLRRMWQMGFGIAIALVLEATIARSVPVPAQMVLLGDWNWYLPRWLDWIPHFKVERGAQEVAFELSSQGF